MSDGYRENNERTQGVLGDCNETTPDVMDTARTTSPRKACEKTARDHARCDGYRKNNEPTQGI